MNNNMNNNINNVNDDLQVNEQIRDEHGKKNNSKIKLIILIIIVVLIGIIIGLFLSKEMNRDRSENNDYNNENTDINTDTNNDNDDTVNDDSNPEQSDNDKNQVAEEKELTFDTADVNKVLNDNLVYFFHQYINKGDFINVDDGSRNVLSSADERFLFVYTILRTTGVIKASVINDQPVYEIATSKLKTEYEKILGTDDFTTSLNEVKNASEYFDIVGDNIELFEFTRQDTLEVSFSANKLTYNATDEIYTLTGDYNEKTEDGRGDEVKIFNMKYKKVNNDNKVLSLEISKK